MSEGFIDLHPAYDLTRIADKRSGTFEVHRACFIEITNPRDTLLSVPDSVRLEEAMKFGGRIGYVVGCGMYATWSDEAAIKPLRELSERRSFFDAIIKRWSIIDRKGWYRHYYLHSDEWKRKAAAVRRRAGAKCEGCGMAHVRLSAHHLTYAHVGNEFLWELVAICDGCHERAHETGDVHP